MQHLFTPSCGAADVLAIVQSCPWSIKRVTEPPLKASLGKLQQNAYKLVQLIGAGIPKNEAMPPGQMVSQCVVCESIASILGAAKFVGLFGVSLGSSKGWREGKWSWMRDGTKKNSYRVPASGKDALRKKVQNGLTIYYSKGKLPIACFPQLLTEPCTV